MSLIIEHSQDDPTRSIFSVTISTAAKRAVFIASVKTFLTTYGLDGIGRCFKVFAICVC
jgi:hypothetical protein